ncbi:PREDICTED: uncharacterized protein LOC104825172 [Tarenaya hassleriana]|uniref:uncharacterized protein LOC104825172 n=1 Tax=Tarenaya hassleriana TaxID=28532 RepID=UPI00053C5891|nr:PREDICTED: uncharacterized protein LOC104825172 [Tarenaya hassleriana]
MGSNLTRVPIFNSLKHVPIVLPPNVTPLSLIGSILRVNPPPKNTSSHRLLVLHVLVLELVLQSHDQDTQPSALLSLSLSTNPPATTTLKTAEILSKYRPIAPKPETSPSNNDDPSSSMSHKINQSPYLRSLWPQLQARPTRTRKRGRGSMTSSPPTLLGLKRTKTTVTPTSQHVLGFPGVQTLSFQAIPGLAQVGFALENVVGSSGLVTLPLLQCSTTSPLSGETKCMELEGKEKRVIDLNMSAESLKERDFLGQLQGPSIATTTNRVIAPHPIRPVGSKISVSCINPDKNSPIRYQITKTSQEVEEEVESDDLPALITDSNNRVRLVNSAFKEMVGQPECSWMDSMVNGKTNRGKRICGEVILCLCDPRPPFSDNGFSCWARIEWGRDEDKKLVDTLCHVARLSCMSKNYIFSWRFHTNTKGSSCSGFNA